MIGGGSQKEIGPEFPVVPISRPDDDPEASAHTLGMPLDEDYSDIHI